MIKLLKDECTVCGELQNIARLETRNFNWACKHILSEIYLW